MSRLLISDEYPHSHQLDAVFDAIRQEIVKGSRRITHDGCPETRHLLGHVLECNSKALDLLNEAKATLSEIFYLTPANQPVPVAVKRRAQR